MRNNFENTNALKMDIYWMQKAIDLAKEAFIKDEVPVGAIVVQDNKIIGSGYNNPISIVDATAHAEIIALREACKNINNYRLIDATLYVTLEPCMMCAGAMLHARIKRLVFGAFDEKTGVVGSVCNLVADYKWNHSFSCTGNILGKESSALLSDFFKSKRKRK